MEDACDLNITIKDLVKVDPHFGKLHFYGLMVETCVAIGYSLAYKYYHVSLNIPTDSYGNGLEGMLTKYRTLLTSVGEGDIEGLLVVNAKLTQWPDTHVCRSNLWKDAQARVGSISRSANTVLECHVNTMKIVKAAYVQAHDTVRATYIEVIKNDWSIANSIGRSAAVISQSSSAPPVQPELDYGSMIDRMDYQEVAKEPDWVMKLKTDLEVISGALHSEMPNISEIIDRMTSSSEWTEMRLMTCKENSIRLVKSAHKFALMPPAEARQIIQVTQRFRTDLGIVESKVVPTKTRDLYS